MPNPVKVTDTGERPHPLVEEIKGALRRCASVIEVNDTARHYAYEVAQMDAADGYLRTMAIQIKNLAKVRRQFLPEHRPKEG